MEKNIKRIVEITEKIIKNNLKLFGLKQAESLAVLLAFISTILLIALLLSILVIFASLVLSEVLNELFNSSYLGYICIGGLYILIILFLLFRIKSANKPVFTNFFIKLLLSFLKIETSEDFSSKGLQREKDKTHEEIDSDKENLIVLAHLAQYSLVNGLKKDIGEMLTSKINQLNVGVFSSLKESKTNVKEKLWEEVLNWQSKINEARNRVGSWSSDAREEVMLQIDKLEKELAVLKEKWKELNDMKMANWEKFQTDFHSALKKIKIDFDEITSTIKN